MTECWHRNVLVVAPHPDDEVLGCGGSIARFIAEGDRVIVCIVTRGINELFDDAYIEQGRSEARGVHAQLGVANTLFMDFPAPMLDTVPLYRIADAFAQIASKERIDTVYVPHHGDIHHDHTAVFNAALVAYRPINACLVRRIYAYETLSETEWAPPHGDSTFRPNVFIDISAHIEAKIEAMQGYRTQLKQSPHPRSVEGIRALAMLRGFTVGCQAAEAFMLVREIQ